MRFLNRGFKNLQWYGMTSRGYKKDMAQENPDFIGVFFVSGIRFREPKMFLTRESGCRRFYTSAATLGFSVI